MHLATLRPQTPHVSIYFVGGVGVVGGYPRKVKGTNGKDKKCPLKTPA